LKGKIYLGDAAFVNEMQKRIGREKDDLNIPQQQKRPTAKQRLLPFTKTVHIANEKSGSTINCIQRQLELSFVRTRILDSGHLFAKQMSQYTRSQAIADKVLPVLQCKPETSDLDGNTRSDLLWIHHIAEDRL